MADHSKIAWCDRTFNPWIGCTKVSAGCKFCYAETLMDHRYGKVKWGPAGTRVRTSAAYWKKPLQWNKEAWRQCEGCGYRAKEYDGPMNNCCSWCYGNFLPTRQRIFCASLADVFEDVPQLELWRIDLFRLIFDTPNLDWLLLTKRPEQVQLWMDHACWPETGCQIFGDRDPLPSNVWIGTSVEDQETADDRIMHLLDIPAAVHWLSVEPQLGPIDLSADLSPCSVYCDHAGEWPGGHRPGTGIDWVVVGGESGAQARPFDIDWARSIRDQCRADKVSFFMKQLGGHPSKRDAINDFPEDLRIREFPR